MPSRLDMRLLTIRAEPTGRTKVASEDARRCTGGWWELFAVCYVLWLLVRYLPAYHSVVADEPSMSLAEIGYDCILSGMASGCFTSEAIFVYQLCTSFSVVLKL